MWDTLKGTVAKVAPLLAAALGTEDSPAAVEAEIQRNPDALVKLR